MQDIQEPEIFRNGTAWSGHIEGESIAGEAWHLAALASDRDPGICMHEVLYVGMAYGSEGNRNAGDRLKAHEKLQEIYGDHEAYDVDIYVTPVTLDLSWTIYSDHTEVERPVLGQGGQLIDEQKDPIRAYEQSIKVVEHALVSYFQPEYNDRLKTWKSSKHFDPFLDSAYSLIVVSLLTHGQLPQFFSTTRPESETHMIVAELPGIVNPTEYTIGSFDQSPLASIKRESDYRNNSLKFMGNLSKAATSIAAESIPYLLAFQSLGGREVRLDAWKR